MKYVLLTFVKFFTDIGVDASEEIESLDGSRMFIAVCFSEELGSLVKQKQVTHMYVSVEGISSSVTMKEHMLQQYRHNNTACTHLKSCHIIITKM